jgi:hypothetical protein
LGPLGDPLGPSKSLISLQPSAKITVAFQVAFAL